MTDPTITALKLVIVLCVAISGYCIWELWQDRKIDQQIRRGMLELRKRGEI